MTYRKVQTVTDDKYEALVKEILERDAKLRPRRSLLCQQTDEYLEWLEEQFKAHDPRTKTSRLPSGVRRTFV